MIIVPILITIAVTFAIFKDPYPKNKTIQEQSKVRENGTMDKVK